MNEPLFLSVINLIARPSDYDRKRVRVIGFSVVAFELHALFLSEADSRAGVTKNALWLEVIDAEIRQASGGMVLVEGTFDATSLGHLQMYSGTLKDIGRFSKWGDWP
jgi:hypothetical protein